MKNLNISTKILLLSAGLIATFTLMVGWMHVDENANLNRSRHDEIKAIVDTAWGVLSHYQQAAQSGALPLAEAQRDARQAIRDMRFNGNDYFFIIDETPRMVMHPIEPALDGKDLSEKKDPQGKRLFVAMAQVAKESGAGFVRYVWNKPGSDHPVGKVTYVRLLPEWGWVIGAGLYVDDIEAQMHRVLYTTIAVYALVILIGLVLIVLLSRSISRPLARAVTMIQELERGHLGMRLRLNRKDEIGVMADAMDGFADDLQREVVDALQKLAQGDLTFDAHPRDADDVLRGSLKKLEEDLHQLIGQVRTSGDQIVAGAMQISDSSQALSQGATEQASSLEQISASMHQLSSQTQHNADSAAQANRLATQVRTEAEEGNTQMQQMVAAMAEIDGASQNISKIIKVIDEIAFQTNLLALNAAVEAARAGQHGKGFAVVAEEVRNLAARSARAAKETAELIEGSVRMTGNGSKIADRTAKALAEIVADVSKVTDLVAEIAAASNEQAQGIGQVSQGVAQIDQVTQQNTANAEEGAAASEELHSQAGQLRQMLRRFTLKERRAAAAPDDQAGPEGVGIPALRTGTQEDDVDEGEAGARRQDDGRRLVGTVHMAGIHAVDPAGVQVQEVEQDIADVGDGEDVEIAADIGRQRQQEQA